MKTKPTSASAAPASETSTKAHQKPIGRPPKGAKPMTPAERQSAYRLRQRVAALNAYAEPVGQPTPAILAALGRLLAQLDDPDMAAEYKTLRRFAQSAVRELCTRYGITVSLR